MWSEVLLSDLQGGISWYYEMQTLDLPNTNRVRYLLDCDVQ